MSPAETSELCRPSLHLLDAAMKGTSVHEIRRRIKERKEQGRATERIGERVGNYTASVQGPSGRGANDKMRAAVEALLQKLKLNHS